jgi:hypothetical protein
MNFGENGQNESKFSFFASNAEPERETTLPGIANSLTAVKAKAYFSIRCNLESDSNVIDASDLHSKKHDSQITSTD